MNKDDAYTPWLVSSDIFLALEEFISNNGSHLPESISQRFSGIQANNEADFNFIPMALLGEAFQFAEDKLNNKHIALHCGATSVIKHWGFLGYLIQSCQTTGAALATLDQYSKLITNQYSVSIHHNEKKSWLGATAADGKLDRYSRHFTVYIISSFLHFVRQWTTLESPCESFHFPWKAEASKESYEALLNAPCFFDAPELKIQLSKDTLKYTLQHYDPKLHQLMLEKTTELYQHLTVQDDWLIALKEFILNHLSSGTPSLTMASAHLNLGERTLRRKLEKVGLSYQSLLDDTRKDIAICLVKEAKLSLMEISLRLGFSEQSSFHRAFKRWTGKTPLQY